MTFLPHRLPVDGQLTHLRQAMLFLDNELCSVDWCWACTPSCPDECECKQALNVFMYCGVLGIWFHICTRVMWYGACAIFWPCSTTFNADITQQSYCRTSTTSIVHRSPPFQANKLCVLSSDNLGYVRKTGVEVYIFLARFPWLASWYVDFRDPAYWYRSGVWP